MIWYFFGDDSLRQAFDDSRLAHTGLTDQHGIVLGTTTKDSDHAFFFASTTDHRVKFASSCLGCEVNTKDIQWTTICLFLAGTSLGAEFLKCTLLTIKELFKF